MHRIDSLAQLERELPARLRAGARVLKQLRGQSGVGVWRVELAAAGSSPPLLGVRHAQRGSEEVRLDLAALLELLAPYFEPEAGGHMIDQAWQPRLADGMVRAYLVQDRVAGFGFQAVNALYPAVAGQAPVAAGPRLYYATQDLPQFHGLQEQLESQWVGLLCGRVGLAREQLPLLWDCDFMFGEPAPDGGERFVLCEINVSSVSPFPPSAIGPIVAAVRSRLAR